MTANSQAERTGQQFRCWLPLRRRHAATPQGVTARVGENDALSSTGDQSTRRWSNGDVQHLTDRVFLLRESLDEGRLKIAAHLWDGFVTRLQKIRVGEDGLVLPGTVDGRIRALTTGLRVLPVSPRRLRKRLASQISSKHIFGSSSSTSAPSARR